MNKYDKNGGLKRYIRALNAVVNTITNMRLHLEAAAQQHQIFNDISQSSLALFTIPHFFASHFQRKNGPLYATMNVFGLGSVRRLHGQVSVQKKYFLGNVCLKKSGQTTNNLRTKRRTYVLHN